MFEGGPLWESTVWVIPSGHLQLFTVTLWTFVHPNHSCKWHKAKTTVIEDFYTLQQMLFITSLNGLVVGITKRRAHSCVSWTSPLQTLSSHNESTQLCHYAFITVLVQICGLLNRTKKMKSGEAVHIHSQLKTGFTHYMIHRQCGNRRATLLGPSFL